MFFPHGLEAGMFVKAPLKAVEACLLFWANGHPADCELEARQVRMPLGEAISCLEPRFFSPDRGILIAHQSGWTAYFDNHSRQFEPQSAMYVLCERMRTTTVFFAAESTGVHAGSAVFNHYHHRCPQGVTWRSLWLGNESGWRFDANGEPLPFEQLDVYKSKRIKDRLTPELLKQYGEAMGLRFWEEATYSNEVSLLAWRGQVSTTRRHGREDA